MAEKFNIKPGVYVVPDFGRIDCTKKVKQTDAVALYLNKKFSSFITLTEAGVDLLKKEKLNAKEVATLINSANSKEEVKLLLKVKTTDTLKSIAENKINSIE